MTVNDKDGVRQLRGKEGTDGESNRGRQAVTKAEVENTLVIV